MVPPIGVALKLNFDGSSLGNPSPSRCGGLSSDASGDCVVAYSSPLGLGDAVQAEIKALLVGLRLFHSRGDLHIPLVVEGDLAIAIEWMKSGSPGPWRISHLIKETVFLASTLNISFSWIPREANFVADGLAKKGVSKRRTLYGLN